MSLHSHGSRVVHGVHEVLIGLWDRVLCRWDYHWIAQTVAIGIPTVAHGAVLACVGITIIPPIPPVQVPPEQPWSPPGGEVWVPPPGDTGWGGQGGWGGAGWGGGSGGGYGGSGGYIPASFSPPDMSSAVSPGVFDELPPNATTPYEKHVSRDHVDYEHKPPHDLTQVHDHQPPTDTISPPNSVPEPHPLGVFMTALALFVGVYMTRKRDK